MAGGVTLVGQTNEPGLSREDGLLRARGNSLPNAVGVGVALPGNPPPFPNGSRHCHPSPVKS